jgi:hypothetical protein
VCSSWRQHRQPEQRQLRLARSHLGLAGMVAESEADKDAAFGVAADMDVESVELDAVEEPASVVADKDVGFVWAVAGKVSEFEAVVAELALESAAVGMDAESVELVSVERELAEDEELVFVVHPR